MANMNDDEKLNFVLDKMRKESAETKVSPEFSDNFQDKLDKLNQKAPFFQNSKLVAASVFSLALIFVTIYLVKDLHTSKNDNLKTYQTDSLAKDINNNEVAEGSKRTEDLVASIYDAKNFEDNSVLSNYYGQMRSGVDCQISSPALGKVIVYSNQTTKIEFVGKVNTNSPEEIKLLLKIYLGSNQASVRNLELITDKNGNFSADAFFELPGQYSWKIVYADEIAAAGNFFLGKLPAK